MNRVGPGGLEPPSRGYQPRILPVEPQADLPNRMGPEGLEPPPPGLKGRRASVTPRPRRRRPAGRAFDLDHRAIPPRSGRPDSNRRSPAPKAGGFPLSYVPSQDSEPVRAAGFEPAFSSTPSSRIARLSHALITEPQAAREGVEPSSPHGKCGVLPVDEQARRSRRQNPSNDEAR
jgi:hypothetical protein